MPGRLIALAASPGTKLKGGDYCFPLSLIEALEGNDFNLLLLVAGSGPYMEMARVINPVR